MITVCTVNYNFSSTIRTHVDLPYVGFKTYYEDNGKHDVKWVYPFSNPHALSIDELVDRIMEHDPDVVGFSLYVWNRLLSLKVAEQIKIRKPAVRIAVGGPDQRYAYEPNWFDKHWYVDIACDTDGYGEPFITDLLDQVSEGVWNPADITYSVVGKQGMLFKGKKSFSKRDFKWPRNIYSRNADYIEYLVGQPGPLHGRVIRQLTVEYSRGCPFGCVYCEWGGGTMSKVNFKPTEYILEDLEFMIKNYDPNVIQITDANFGITERDITITRRIADYRLENKYALTHLEAYGMVKNNYKHIGAIYEAVIEARLLGSYGLKMSVQDFDEGVLKNIKRPIDDWEEILEIVTPILRKYNESDHLLRFEMMLGLPGTTLDIFYDSFNHIKHLIATRWPWEMIPTSPGADQDYVNKYDVKILRQRRLLTPTGNETDLIIRNGIDTKPETILGYPEYSSPTDIVISTYSYTPTEWAEMFMVHEMRQMMIQSHLLVALSKYIGKETNINSGEFMRSLWNDFMLGDFMSPMQQSLVKTAWSQLKEKTNSTECFDLHYVDIGSVSSFDVSVDLTVIFKLIIQINPIQFFEGMRQWAARFNDPAIIDCISWMEQSIITIYYDPDNPPVVECNYNWFEYYWDFEPLVAGKYKYDISDTHLGDMHRESVVDLPTWSEANEGINWHKYPIEHRVQHILLPYCSDPNLRIIFANWKRKT